MRKLLTLSLLGVFVLTAGIAQANELANPGFETNPTDVTPGDWFKFAGTCCGADPLTTAASVHSTVEPRSGTGHMHLSMSGPLAFAGVFQDLGIVINEGDAVTFSGWHKSVLDPYLGTREAKIEWHGAPQLRVDTFVLGTQYEQFSISGVAPAGTTGATITYSLSSFNPGAGATQVYIDDFDVTIERIPEPSTALLGGLALLGFVARRRKD